jgi:hypothetical protein
MALSKQDAIEKAQKDLAKRLNLDSVSITEKSVEEVDFPDTALGAATNDEMSGQMLTRGWRIKLQSEGKTYEYRADKNQVRLYGFKGKNFLV